MSSSPDSQPGLNTPTYARHAAEIVEETVVVPDKSKKAKASGEAQFKLRTIRFIRIDGQVLPLPGASQFITLDWCAHCLNSLASDPSRRCTFIKGLDRKKCDNCSASHTGTSIPCNLPIAELRPIGTSMVIAALKLGDIRFEIFKLKSSTEPDIQTEDQLRMLQLKFQKAEEMYKKASDQWKKVKSELDKSRKAEKSAEQVQTTDEGRHVENTNIEAKDDGTQPQTEGGKIKDPSKSKDFAVHIHPTHAAAPFVQRLGAQGVFTTGETLIRAMIEVHHAFNRFNSLVQARPPLDAETLRQLQLEHLQIINSIKQYSLGVQKCQASDGQVRPAIEGQSSSAPVGQSSSATGDQSAAVSIAQSSSACKKKASSGGKRKRKSTSAHKSESSASIIPTPTANMDQVFSAPNGAVHPASLGQSSSASIVPTPAANMDQVFAAPNDAVRPASLGQISSASIVPTPAANMDQIFSAPNDAVRPASLGESSSANDVQMGGTLDEEILNDIWEGLDFEMVGVDSGQTPLPEPMY